MTRSLVAGLIIVLLSAVRATAQSTAAPYFAKNVFVAEPEFSEGRVSAQCRDMLSRQQARFMSVWFFTSEQAAAEYLYGVRNDHISYGAWRRSYDLHKGIKPVAHMISIGDSCVLLFRGVDGAVSAHILSGKNPLDIVVGEGEVVHMVDLVPTKRGHEGKDYRINVFAWTPRALTEGLGLQVLADLEPRLPYPEIDLSLRNDPWFIDEPFFPVFSPFVPEFSPPTRDQYTVSPTLLCGTAVMGDRRGCVMHGLHK